MENRKVRHKRRLGALLLPLRLAAIAVLTECQQYPRSLSSTRMISSLTTRSSNMSADIGAYDGGFERQAARSTHESSIPARRQARAQLDEHIDQ
jgi:uncharacterized lipoprotein YajG